MTATQGNLAGLSRYIFRAPRWYSSLTFALALAALTGIAVFDSRYVLEDAWQGVFFIGIPTVVASGVTATIDRSLGGRLTANRASLLAVVCEVVIVLFLLGSGLVAAVTDLGAAFVFDALLVGLASAFALWLLVILSVSRTSVLLAAIPASVQPVVAAALLFVYSGTMRYVEFGGPLTEAYLLRIEDTPDALVAAFTPRDFTVLVVLCGIYAVAVWGFLVTIDRPWRNSLGVSVLDFVRGFVGHVAEGSRELEDFFEAIGEEAVVPVTVLSFRRPSGEEKARFVLPMIHPGPMGEIGGGNLPVRIARTADGLAFPPHATAGHDFNLVTEREVGTLIDAAERAAERIEYDGEATASVRGTDGEATVLGQAFGDDLLLVSTFSPACADDVEYGVGLAAAAEARSSGFDDVLLADAHNCNDGLSGSELGHVVPGSERSFELLAAASDAAAQLADADRRPLELGTAWERTDWTLADGIGPLGVRVAVIDAGGRTTAYVLIDGNNMVPGLREQLIEAVDGVDRIEIMTTDTHVVNQVDAENQVGDRIDEGELEHRVRALVDEALDDREPVEAGMASERARVTVFGNDRTETLASHANAAVSMGAAFASAVILAALAISVVVFVLA